MLSDRALARALERAGLRAPVRFVEVTPSTQDVALAMASDGAPEWTLVAAGHQTAGRGRLDRTWHDRAGSALLCSLVLRPRLEPASGGLITLAAGLALAEAIEEMGVRDAACWWPNDVLVTGRKAAGILATSTLLDDAFEHVVLGFGVNLGESPVEQPDAGAVDATDAELLEAFLRRFAERYGAGDAAFGPAMLDAYRGRCATLGEGVRATTVDGAVVEGVAAEVDGDGGLIVDADGGRRVVRFGDVERLSSAVRGAGPLE